MAGQAATLKEILERLEERDLVDELSVEPIAIHLDDRVRDAEMPWYIKALVGVGAWFAAYFFLISIFIFFWSRSLEGSGTIIAIGLLSIGVGTILANFAKQDSIFLAQLALALSLMGHAATLAGIGENTGGFSYVPWAAAALVAVLYPLYRDATYRFLGTLIVTGTFTAWFLSERDLHHFIHAMVLLETAGVCVLFLRGTLPEALRPLAYGLAASLCLTPLFVLMPADELSTPWWPSSAILALGLIWLYIQIAKRHGKVPAEPLAIAVAATIIFSASTPGILAVILLITLGYLLDDRLLLTMGIIFMPVYIATYYYSLNVDLLTKSFVLMGSGAFLIVVRAVLNFRPWAREALRASRGEAK